MDAPAIIHAPVYHKVARCRWCKGRFTRIYTNQWICENGSCADRCVSHAIPFPFRDVQESPWFYLPLPGQVDVRESTVTHLLVAGAAGAFKSYGLRMEFYALCAKIPGFRALLLRCTYDELYKNHLQFMPAEAKLLGDDWKFSGGGGSQPKQMANVANDGIIFFGYCEHKADIPKHLGSEWDAVGFEEAVTHLPEGINEITAKARGAAPSRQYREAHGIGGITRLASNPGGRAMLYLSDMYITKDPDPEEYREYDPSLYGYISATLDDNPYLAEDYERKHLSGLSAARYKQLRHGDWSVFAGQFFSSYDPSIHVRRMEAS